MNLGSVNSVYFVGIGGIGMSALARYFNHLGKEVAGYDRTPTELTAKLEAEGINIHFADDVVLVPTNCKDPLTTLVIYTPAVPAGHQELNFFKQNGFNVLKRAAVLGLITESHKGVCIAGTHGKTTVSTIAAHLLHGSEHGCNAFLGGISKNYNSNLLLDRESDYAVIEADEFDRSFLHLHPYLALVTAVDADHLDIYGDHEAIRQSFAQFVGKLTAGGSLVIKQGVDLKVELAQGVQQFSYALNNSGCDFFASNIRLVDGFYQFDLSLLGHFISNLSFGQAGLINVENAVAASSLAWLAGATEDEIRKGLASFQGIRRRFDYQIRTKDLVYIDDYAHHPEELKAAISSARSLYPDKWITGIFQPHLFSRTQDFAVDFAASLDLLDELILLDIYPARELPIVGVTAALIFDKVKTAKKVWAQKEEVCDLLLNSKPQVLLTLGAGDIDKLVAPIKDVLYSVVQGIDT